MSIFINSSSKVIVQGMTGSEGTKHTRRMLASGTQVVGGVTPGKGGQVVDIDGTSLPVFNTVTEAIAATGANVSVVFVPPKFAKAAVIDAIDAAMPLVVVITEGIPVHDSAFFYSYSLTKGKTQIIGPNCPGLISEIGGDAEERAAAFIAEYVTKPVVGYVAGFTAPEGKTMGHAGAIVSGSSGTAQAKKDALEAAGVKVGQTPSETARLMREILGR